MRPAIGRQFCSFRLFCFLYFRFFNFDRSLFLRFFLFRWFLFSFFFWFRLFFSTFRRTTLYVAFFLLFFTLILAQCFYSDFSHSRFVPVCLLYLYSHRSCCAHYYICC